MSARGRERAFPIRLELDGRGGIAPEEAAEIVTVAVPVEVEAHAGAEFRQDQRLAEQVCDGEETGEQGAGAAHFIGLGREIQAFEDECLVGLEGPARSPSRARRR